MTTGKTLESFKQSFNSISQLTGEDFFRRLVGEIGGVLQAEAVWVSEYHKEQNSMTTKAFWQSGNYLTNFTYLIAGTPCEDVIHSGHPVHYSDSIRELFPDDHKMLSKFSAESYTGAALHDDKGSVIGSLAFLNCRVVPDTDDINYILSVIKTRAEAEMQRLRKELEIIDREYQLRGLINGVQDLLINLNHKGQIIMMNATAEATLGLTLVKDKPYPIASFLTASSRSNLLSLVETLNQEQRQRYLWIPGSMEMISTTGEKFLTEGTLSKYELDDLTYYSLVLRNRSDKTEPGEKAKDLIHRTALLQEELEEIKSSNQLLGESYPMRRLLQNIYMVAHTDATVLITGETGTGKELVARHIHLTSNRKNKPMITVNCGAIPASLIESEFFGHAKGAFTGATAERKGRFQLADGGTIFLDEIGELPLDVQVKLLRVVQEGEFEPVGSSVTVKVNVRIITATHRNLFELSKENKFREDLYYRLNVFPIEVPPLRERGDDLILVANHFIQKFSKKSNKSIPLLNIPQSRILKSYSWPGNIRELQNIVERAVILTTDGDLQLDHLFENPGVKTITDKLDDDDRILTRDELIEFEKKNIIKALKACKWKVSGNSGAAALLRMVPSTLSSRIATLGIKTPQ